MDLPILLHKNSSVQKMPTETQKISGSVVFLSQAVDDRSPIIVTSTDGKTIYGLEEDDRVSLSENKFRCYYGDGRLIFHPSQDDKYVDINYYGTGYYSLSSSRIHYSKDEMKVEKLSDILAEAVNSLTLVRDTTKESKQATSIANECIKIINQLKDELTTSENQRNISESNRENNTKDLLSKLSSEIDKIIKMNNDISTQENIRIDKENIRNKSEEDRIKNTTDSLEKAKLEIDNLIKLNSDITLQEDKRKKDNEQLIKVGNEEIAKIRKTNEYMTIQESNISKNEDDRKKNFAEMKSTIDEFSICDEDYNPDKEYKKFNKIIYLGSTYQCKKCCKGINPTDKEFWTCIAAKGRDGTGAGDMLKSDYDKNNNGIVDNAEKVNGFTVECNVPQDAKFTDTVYTHPETHPAIMIVEDDVHKFISKEKLNQIDVNANEITKIKESVGVAVIISDTDVKLKENQVLFKIIQRK